MSSPRKPYRPERNFTPFGRYQDAAARGIAAARRALAESDTDHATIEPDPGEEPCSNPE